MCLRDNLADRRASREGRMSVANHPQPTYLVGREREQAALFGRGPVAPRRASGAS